MEITIDIDKNTCIKCGKCVRVCPSLILTQVTNADEVVCTQVESCIGCGHCVDVCPTGSVQHSTFPATKTHPVNYALYPSPEQLMMLCKGRRSNRAFTTKPIPEQALTQILEAAHCAPTASNSQKVAFLLVTDAKQLTNLSGFTLTVFGKVVKILSTPGIKQIVKQVSPATYRYIPLFTRLQQQYAQGNDMILRRATATIIMYTPKGYRFGAEDCNLAYQNASLMAESLGVSQFYMGFVLSAIKQKAGALEAQLGIDGTICAAMALAMPSFRYLNYSDRDDIQLTRL